MIGALLLGSMATGAVILAARGVANRRAPQTPPRRRDRCAVAVVLFVPDGQEGEIIDRATGRRGFSHAALDGCEVDEAGRHVLIDCQPGRGVHRRVAETYGERPRVYCYLGREDGAEAYGCARARVGEPFDPVGLVVPRTGPGRGVVCSQLVADCLPARVRQRIATTPGRPISPNDLARAFGAEPGGPDVEVP